MAERERIPARQYASPWRERMPDGTLGPEYGPRSAATFAKLHAMHRDWTYKPPKRAAKQAIELQMWMRLEDGTLRMGVPESEVRVYRLVVEQGHSIRWVARRLEISRESVRSYLRRLRARMVRPVE